jgi:PAS domain S-box-containing protein
MKSDEAGLTAREHLHNAILSSLGARVAVLNKQGFIEEVSESWTRFAQEAGAPLCSTGVSANYLEVCRRSEAACPEARQVLEGILSVMNGDAPSFRCEYRCDSPSGPGWFVVVVTSLHTAEASVVIVHQDNTEIKKAEIRYSELLDSVRAIVWRADATSFQTTFASKQAEGILGYPHELWTKEPGFWIKRLHPEDRDWVVEFSSTAVKEKRQHSFEYRIIAADGRIVWLRNIVNVIVEGGQPKDLVGIAVDITERKEAEAARAEFAGRLLRAQEEERSGIARELHDDIGQKLALLTNKLELLESQMSAFPDKRDAIKDVGTMAMKVAHDIQRLSHGLHSSHLELLGLANATRKLCRDFAEHNEAKVECNVEGIPQNLDKNVATCLFRVLQEGLRNTIKHSNAKKVTISLSAHSNKIRLQLCDDRVGFVPSTETRRLGLGFTSMEERLRLVRGTLTVSSTPGHGTRIEARVPLP